MDKKGSEVAQPKRIAKWGFGMAPISKNMMGRYLNAVDPFIIFLTTSDPRFRPELDAVSELKGMFNRCLRQDQWDWFSVYQQFGFPHKKTMYTIVSGLVDLRIGLKNGEDVSRTKNVLQRADLAGYLRTFKSSEVQARTDQKSSKGWIYILSTREEPDVLKIGMTKRSVELRVKEINAATGVLVPFGARRVFAADDAARAEREIFALLSEYRIRPDREFFRLRFAKASDLIEEYFRRLSTQGDHE